MTVCNVIGNMVSTRKHQSLTGCKLLMVKQWNSGETFVAVDNIGAGTGEWVLVARGSTAGKAFAELGSETVCADAAVVGIIDEESCRAWNLTN